MKEDAFDFTGKMPKLLKKPMYSWRDFAAGRRNKECYELYFTTGRFVPHLEKAIWHRKLTKAKEDRDVITISSEAFGLLLLQNQWKHWLQMFEFSAGTVGSVKINENLLDFLSLLEVDIQTNRDRMMTASLRLA